MSTQCFLVSSVVELISQWHPTALALYIGLANAYRSTVSVTLWKDVCLFVCV